MGSHGSPHAESGLTERRSSHPSLGKVRMIALKSSSIDQVIRSPFSHCMQPQKTFLKQAL